MLITISGMIGSGKGTVATLLGKRLGLPVYSIGDIRRTMARQGGLTLEEYNRYGETHPSTDREPDQWAKQKARQTGRGIFEGRVMFHFIPQSVKIFLDCNEQESARRISRDRHAKRKNEADLTETASALAAIRRRIKSDNKRYRKYYHLNVFDLRHYDLVIDTTRLTPHAALNKILKYLANYKNRRR